MTTIEREGRITEADRCEIERFVIFLRLANQAALAGVPQAEASAAIYPDVYEGSDGEIGDGGCGGTAATEARTT